MQTHLWIENKAGELVRFIPNDVQCVVLGAMLRQWRAGLPVRLIILKARQEGVSTAIQAFFYTLVHHRAHVKALISAHDAEGSNTVFTKARRFHERLPEHVKAEKKLRYSNRYEIDFDTPHDSLFRVQVAGENLGRSATYQLLHLSELAFWENAPPAIQSVLATMPKNVHATAVVIESTANGDAGEFHERWQRATINKAKYPDKLDYYMPLFFSWLDCDEYTMALDDGESLDPLDEDEEALVRNLGAAKSQLKWRRWTLDNEYAGDLLKFRQDYPATPDEAFISTGDHAIDEAIRRQHHATAKQPKYVRLEWEHKASHTVRMIPCDYSPGGCWRIWEEPATIRDYAVGGDVGEGIPCDPNNPRSKPDRSSATVLDRRSLTTAAMYVGRVPPDVFGEEMLKASWFYNHAWVSPEANSIGLVTLNHIRNAGYDRIYRRQFEADQPKVGEKRRLGWKTTNTTRNGMIDRWMAACRPDRSDGFLHKVKCLSAELADEEGTFVSVVSGKSVKRRHRNGKFDDVLFGAMIALMVHEDCPREFGEVAETTTTGQRLLGAAFIGGYPSVAPTETVALETS